MSGKNWQIELKADCILSIVRNHASGVISEFRHTSKRTPEKTYEQSPSGQSIYFLNLLCCRMMLAMRE
ncbi:MAG: hypothetical protein COA78_38115 [Blastopirellula sp.]|nr:MAG: hypothetical protein COA78_38115 [Blastopirellula sp.]